MPEPKGGGWSELVDAETIGQYTGLRDKNGVKIFEGDIVQLVGNDSRGDKWDDTPLEIYWSDEDFQWQARNQNYDMNMRLWELFTFHGGCVEVIGNIHDTPELLEGEK